MTVTTQTLANNAAEAKQYYDRRLLRRALPILQLYKAGQKRNLPKNSGNSVSFRRFNKLNTVPTALTEGVIPNGTNLSLTEVTVTVSQYGNFLQVSDALDVTGVDPVVLECTTLMSENGAQTVEEVIRSELITDGTSIMYATGSTRVQQTATSPISLALVRKAVRTLEANDTRPFYGDRSEDNGMGGLFIGFIHPRQWYDLIGDQQVLNTFTYSDPQKLYTMKLPVLGGVAWIKTTKAPYFQGSGASAADVYGTIICGMEAFGVVDVAGTGRFQTYTKPLGSAGALDPLNQIATVGWKSWQAPKVLNSNFMVRIESGVSA